MGKGEDGQDESSANGEGGSQGEAGSTGSRKLIDLRDCLTDSPRFRVRLSEHEAEITDLETRLEKVVTSCDRMVNNGQAYVEACRSFSSSVRELAGHFHDNTIVEQSLRRFYDTLAEVQSFHSILFDQAQRSVQSALRSFLTGELKKVKDMKKTFHKVSDDLSTAVHRNAHAPKSKPQEAEELSSQLANVQTQFSHTAIDYGYHINTVSCIKGHLLLNHLLSYMRAQFTFFHQGYDLLREFDPYMRHVLSQVDDLQKTSEEDIASMNTRHNLVIPQHLKDGSPEEPLQPMDNPGVSIELEGYLFKRSSGAFKSWSRRWFVLGHNQLCYQSESKAEDLVVVVEDLRICTIKMAEDLDRRFCFEVVTPIRSSLLQADSEAWRRTWMAYLEGGIARALRITASNKKKDDTHELRVRTATLCRDRSPTPELSESPILGKKAGSMASIYSLGLNFLDVPGNERCADCGNLNPKWASINLGVLLCIECCGIHRNLGVHISKVRSITLDEWEQEMQLIMCALGNTRVNGILEYEIPEHVKKPTPNTSRALREDFIRAKYVLNAFVHPHPDFERPEVPVAPQQPSLQQLLSSNKERQADSSPRTTPRSSPHASKRMLSPSLRLRATKPKSYRPLTSAGPSEADLVDSDDDQLREVSGSNTMSQDSAMSNSMALLAENYKKLEKSGKLKNWNIAKLKTPKKRSLTGGLSGKLSKSYQALNRKFRSDSTKSSKSIADRDAHSDNEDCESGTPLLHTNILSPPPKPPRTFKQRKLDLTGDGDDTFVLFDDNDDFSGDILSAIKEMGVVAVSDVEGSRESEREERLSKSLPNGGLKILDGDSLTSPSGHLTPGRPKSPMNISPLASEPPVRAFPPPPPLSPVHEGVGKTLESEARSQEDDDAVVSPPASIASTQTSVFDAGSEKGTLGRFHSVAEVEEEEPTTTNTISTATLVDNTATSVDPSTTEVTYQSTGFVSLSNEDNVDDTFTEFQSAQPEVTVQDDPGTSSMQESTLSQTLKSAHPEVTIEEAPDTQQSMVPHTSMEFQGAQPEATMQEPPSSAGTSGTQELRLLRTNKDIDFDESKRFSMLSVASTDWYSLDEEEADEDNESNCSADFPELTCSIDYRAVCTEEEQHLFSTPPSSPPLAVMIQGRDKRLDSLRDRSNSPRPKSASPVPTTLKRIEEEYRDMQQRSRRPKSASPCLTKSVSEDEGTRDATLRRQIQSPLANKPEIPDKTEPLEGKEDANSRESSELPSTNSLEENQKTIRSESEGGVEAADESSEMFEDATDAGLEDSSCLSMSAVSATDLSAEKTALPEKKSYSTNTSPTMSEKHKNVSSSSLTRSATDIDLQTKVVKPRFGVRSRQRASTVSGNENVDSISRSSVEEAPTQSKDEEYFVRMIRKTGKDRRPSSECVSFSEQDIVDIFRSSLRGSKVPVVKVEGADDGESTVQAEEKDGDKVDGSKVGDEGGKKRLRVVHSQKEVQVLGGQDVNSDTVETVVIPDNISPDLYLYQSVCTIDLPGILCAKAHGGDINFINFDDEGKSPMLIAIEKCSTHLVEFLYQNGAKLNLTDEKGRGSLHYAALTDDASVVVLLLKRGAKAGAVDNDGKDPVQIAIEQENGDIVTLLRMARLKIEERGNVEDQVAEVYKEFEMAAQTDPERMKRRSKDSSETSSITSRELK